MRDAPRTLLAERNSHDGELCTARGADMLFADTVEQARAAGLPVDAVWSDGAAQPPVTAAVDVRT
ncbi:hypothetical protein GCM10027168_08880 [Streptomyces capparidis]